MNLTSLQLHLTQDCRTLLTVQSSPGTRQRWPVALKGPKIGFQFYVILIYWYTGVLVYWYIGILIYWYTAILVYWCTGLLVYWYTPVGRPACSSFTICCDRPTNTDREYLK